MQYRFLKCILCKLAFFYTGYLKTCCKSFSWSGRKDTGTFSQLFACVSQPAPQSPNPQANKSVKKNSLQSQKIPQMILVITHTFLVPLIHKFTFLFRNWVDLKLYTAVSYAKCLWDFRGVCSSLLRVLSSFSSVITQHFNSVIIYPTTTLPV
jgi:hypothetical protein